MISYRTSYARRNWFICLMCFVMLGGLPLTAQLVAGQGHNASRPLLLNPHVKWLGSFCPLGAQIIRSQALLN
jgi:hypothetical protein